MVGVSIRSDVRIMSRKRRLSPTDDAETVVDDINERIRRLREMLALMAPETGSSALGASFSGYQYQPRERLLLPSPKAANF
jgi:hypothetical protein